MDGERLKTARKNKGYTQVTLAEALNVSKGSVAMWETGKRNPEFETLDALLSLLDVSYDYLTGKSDVEEHNNPTEDELQQIAAWNVEDDIYDTIKAYLSLDSYGKSAVEKLIREENIRCREQKTSTNTSSITIQILVDKNSVQI